MRNIKNTQKNTIKREKEDSKASSNEEDARERK